MLNKLNDEGIKSIKVYELICRIMFQRRRWSEYEMDIVLLDVHAGVWTKGREGWESERSASPWTAVPGVTEAATEAPKA